MTSSTTSRQDRRLRHMKNGRPQLTTAGRHYHRRRQGGVSARATLLLARWIVPALKGAAAQSLQVLSIHLYYTVT